jgi:nitrogen regulatory protein P-II 1
MRYLLVYVTPDRYDALVDALSARRVRGLTVSEATGFGQEHDPGHPEHADRLGVELTRKLRLEIVCHDEEVEELLEAIYASAHSGRRGDGKVFVLPVLDALRLKTGERGQAALGPRRED